MTPPSVPPSGSDELPPPAPASLAICWIAAWLACAIVWLWLEDAVVLANLIDGAAAATIGATGTTLVYAERLVDLRIRARWALGLWRPLVQLGADMRLLAGALVRALTRGERSPGALRTARFEPAGGPGEVAARCALATAAGSFAPNTIVLGVEEDAGLILVHQLVPKPGDRTSIDPLELG